VEGAEFIVQLRVAQRSEIPRIDFSVRRELQRGTSYFKLCRLTQALSRQLK
jgi:hypothetical protein